MRAARKPITSLIIFIVLILLFSVSGIARLITDFLWFKALEFEQIFLISLKAKIGLFVLSALVFFVFLLINLKISSRLKESKFIKFKTKILIAAALSLIIGSSTSAHWFTVLQYLKQVPFSLADPIFAKDVAFYVFSLPFFLFVWKFAMSCVVLTTILVVADYLQDKIAGVFKPPKKPEVINPKQASEFSVGGILSSFKRGASVHITILVSLIFVLLSVRHYLQKYTIMYSERGIVVGAGYTDVTVFLPLIKVLMVVAIFVAIAFFIWIFFFSTEPKLKKRHILSYALIVYVLFYIVGLIVLPGLVQTLKVTPNEINLEKPYIENNIKFTNIAYGLADVEEKEFPVSMGITADVLDEAKETIDNVRILDWRPLTKTYKQTQEIRLYYDLEEGIDIDRYDLDGKYTQVMLAPRELAQSQITPNAQTWVNLHMVYTHGFGAVMSPVNSVTKEGLPNYLIKDIPPVSDVDSIRVDRPQVYYGEQDNDFVLVSTKTNEFDYPKGNTNEYTHYNGKGGVVLSTFMKKLLMAIRFKDIKILLSSDITSESKIMFDRRVQRRISKIMPFLTLDADPYLVINEGRMFWIQDAYTTTGNFPYSEKLGNINYIRNSVKIVMDAYDGDVSYYIINGHDPLIETYSKIFPDQFKRYEDMPAGLKKHIRYPEDLFKAQSTVYSVYHMNDATVFYNKEDAWQIPTEIYGTGQQVKVEPYYIIMNLPGEYGEEFVLMTSFTPIRKDNMIAWMAARSDGEEYGKLLLYKFPKDKLVYGPMQIEAKFDQDSEISQQITLWSQQGSRVTRGNLLVIPIDDSILYIEPLYIQSEQGELPQLKRVLVSDGERVVMEESLGESLEALFGKKEVKKEVTEYNVTAEDVDLIEKANEYYENMLDSMSSNDWQSFGDSFDKLGDVLKVMTEE